MLSFGKKWNLMMSIMMRFRNLSKNNKNLAQNIIGAFLIKGLGLIVNLVSMPLYMRFFSEAKSLGLWFAILSVLTWILSFDMGIGNGLRNHLARAIALKDTLLCKQLISSAYALLGGVTLIIIVALCLCVPLVNLNTLFNIPSDVVSPEGLNVCVSITLIGIVLSFFLRLANSILYALQLAALNNFNHLITSILLVLFLLFANPFSTNDDNLILMGGVYAIVVNLPLIITTILIFTKSVLKDSRPSFSYITRDCSKHVFALGVSFLIVQILYMIITVTNDWFISFFFGTEYCVNYQIYYRIFSLLGTLLMLATSPIWSAVTKAVAEKRFIWLKQIQKLIYTAALVLSLIQIAVLPFLQDIVNVWLKDRAIQIDYFSAWSFVFYSITTIWIAVQSTFVAGIGELKVQTFGYLFAVIIKIVGIVFVSQFVDKWSVVVLITALALLPYCIIQPIILNKRLKVLSAGIV